MTLLLVWPTGSAPQEGPAPLLGGGEIEKAAAAPKFVPGHLLVRFRPGTPRAWQEAAHAGLKAQVLRRYRSVESLAVVRLPQGMSVEKAALLYRRDPNVLYAEPDYIVYADVTPTDTSFGTLWGLHNTGQSGGTRDADTDAPEAWNLSTGSDTVVVGVIDTGIDYTHPDLAANLLQLESNCFDGLDDDGNGHIDDCFGINTVPGALNPSDPMDDNGHGTHVAGTIGARGNNGVGVAGVNWTVRLLACKFLGADGSGSTADAIACLDYFADLKQNHGVNLVATNNSWGGAPFEQSLFDAIDAQRARGILFIAAAGNDATDNDSSPHYPSSYFLPNLIAVASTTRTDTRSFFSNFGRRTVHLGAPGSSILSTTPLTLSTGYSTFSGTSMATPHVTGVAALLKAENAARDWIAIKNLILAGGDTKTSMSNTVTGKRLNAFGAMTCSNSVVTSRLQPVANSTAAAVGSPVTLAALHINCASPNGTVDVTVNPGNTTVTLLDDGFGPDQEAGDGIYTNEWTPSTAGSYTLTFPGGDVVTVNALLAYTQSATAFTYRALKKKKLKNLNLGDDTVAVIKSPFPILFGGGSFSSLRVSANGLITFDGAAPFHNPNQAIPTSLFGTVVAPFWDDLFPISGTLKNVVWKKLGAAPNRLLVIEWRGVRHFDCRRDRTARVRFQVVFFENSSDILFNYLDTTFGGACTGSDGGGSATVGVQIAPGVGTQIGFDTPSVSGNTAILWQLVP